MAAGLWTVGASAQPDLFSDAARSPGALLEREDRVREPARAELDTTGTASGLPMRYVRVDIDRLAGISEDIAAQRTAPTIALNLFEDTRFQAVFDEATPTLWGHSLSGRLEGEPFGTVTLVVHGDIVAGTVRTPAATYAIRSVGVGVHVVEEVEPPTLDRNDAILPPPSVAPPAPRTAPSPDSTQEDDGSEIDVFVFYTPAARGVLQGSRRARAQIALAVAETNAAYAAGGAAQRIRLVGAVETPYEEVDRAFTDETIQTLSHVTAPDDGHMDEVHPIRDAYAADLVHLLTESGTGLAYVSPYNERLAFGRTSVAFGRIPARIFAHELGHNMGLQHDRFAGYNTLNYPFPYSHGYVNQRAFEEGAPADACFYTIMAYPNQCSANRRRGRSLMRFSNPNQRHPDPDGDPLGVPGDQPSEEVDGPADAVRSLNETRNSVANFRASANRCSYRLTRPDDARISMGADGGAFTVRVRADAGCPVAAISHDEFVELVTHRTDQGADVAFRVAGNDGGARLGLITIMGESVEVLQRGRAEVTSVCERSPWMRDILTDLAGRSSCDEVTEFDLAEVYELRQAGRRITGPIEPFDFDGLINLSLLALHSNRLSGPIAGELLGRLRKLRELYLHHNELSGPIPPELGRLDLRELRLRGNALTGPIPPQLGALQRLTGLLWLDDNQLSGSIPEELGNLRNAWAVSLAGNALTGRIPPALGSLERVRELRLHDNDLSGPIPPELGELEHLLELSLRGNALTGCIPGGLRDIRDNDLDQLGLPYCATVSLAHGGPPEQPGEAGTVVEGTSASLTIVTEPAQDTPFDVTVTLSGAEAFGVADGNRTVTIPSGATETPLYVNTENDDVEEPDGALTVTILAGDGFALMTSRSSASIVIEDDEGPSAPTIVSLAPEDGMLTVTWTAPPDGSGSIVEYQIRYRPSPPTPGWQTWKRTTHGTDRVLQRDITGLTNRVAYDVQVRAMTAEGEGAWSKTARGTPKACPDGIELGDCRILLAFRGSLVGGATALNWAVNVAVSEWTGIRVDRLAGRVVDVLLGGRGLRGTLPAQLGGLAGLENLWLHDNELTGSVPAELGRIASLRSLLLAHNELTGRIPAELGSLTELETLWLGYNELTGSIPATLGRPSKLQSLGLAGNRLTGAIPRSLANLTNLTDLRLAGNDLTGCVPASLRDVDQNDLHRLELPDCPPASVIDLAIESLPLDGRAYGTGERIEATVLFETNVTVSGAPRLALTVDSAVRPATFLANRGNGQLAFHYVVGPADRDTDGISIGSNALSVVGGEIRDVDGEPAALDLGEHAIVNHPSHQVRGALRETVPDQELEAGGDTLVLDLSRYFHVPAAGTLTYGTPNSSDPAVATAIIEDGFLKIMPREDGIATITVTATDDAGVTVTLRIRVTVTGTRRGLRPWLIHVLMETSGSGRGRGGHGRTPMIVPVGRPRL